MTVTSILEVPVETKTVETHEVEVIRTIPQEIIREVVVPLRTLEEVIKEVQTQKTILLDKLVVTKERIEIPIPVTVIKEIPLYNERIVEVLVKEESVQEKMVEMTRQVAIEVVRQVTTHVPKIVEIREQVLVEKQVLVEVPVYTTSERIRNVEVIKEVPVEMVREVPLFTHKESVREVSLRETTQIEKVVELRTTEEIIKTVQVVKEMHHDHTVEVPVIIEVEKPENAILMKELIVQVQDLKDYISNLHLSTRSSSHRLASQVKNLERVLATERSANTQLREAVEQLQSLPMHVVREVIKEVPVIREVVVSRPSELPRVVNEDDKISESKFQLVNMLASERALSNEMERERDAALERLRYAHGRLDIIQQIDARKE
mmetsp:Transcript_75844/g.123159  ORF Transcript_75844/g.123159 Transcript_75844/m.123159 type:complete len:376 (+) Transcript_75844:1152-2279(+)